MNEQPEFPSNVHRWLEKAEHDLRNAEYVLTLEDDCPTDTVCFHCQQCAEEYLKALLVRYGVDFPKTHDLVVLLNLAARSCEVTLAAERVQPLNRYSVEARYPGDWEPIGVEEAQKAVNMAREVRAAVRAILSTDVMDGEI